MRRFDSRLLTIDSAGRITLPVDVRRRLNLRAGSRLVLDIVAGRIERRSGTHADPVFGISATKRSVTRPTGRVLDAVAETRAERVFQVLRRRG